MRKYVADENNRSASVTPSPENKIHKSSTNSILKRPQSKFKLKPKAAAKSSARRKKALAANINLRNAARNLRNFASGAPRIHRNGLKSRIEDETENQKFRSVRFDSAASESFSNMLSVPVPTFPDIRALEKAREIAKRHKLRDIIPAEPPEKDDSPPRPMSPIKSAQSSTARSNPTNSTESELIVTEFREVLNSKPTEDEKPKTAPIAKQTSELDQFLRGTTNLVQAKGDF